MTALWLVPTLPLLGFLVLALSGSRLSRGVASAVGVGSVGLAAAAALGVASGFVSSPPPDGRFAQTLWTWMSVGGLEVSISLVLDPLSLVMITVIGVTAFLILVYSTEFMSGDEGYARFFAYMDLFVGSMMVLVLAGDLLLLYLGWEAVGLCSFLLIGFWYRDPDNGRAARKAFVVTRLGDAALAVGLFLLVARMGTLDLAAVLDGAAAWETGSGVAVAVAALLLAGAVGKSAQLPLQTWLPDAMAGPTPVSALIHAATMVTAGVYLVARTHPLFVQAPVVQAAVAVIGALTLVMAAFAALAQRDIKRVLAWSTVSQVGYMFLALGVGAWSAAVFHFTTHAWFKALLFLAAGSVILARDGEHDILAMGGLRRALPVTFWTFLAGAASLAALPLVTAGFFSKDLILWRTWTASGGPGWLWVAGLAGALLTGLYIFRVVFLVFFGEGPAGASARGHGEGEGTTPEETAPERPGRVISRPGWRIQVPLVVLAVLSVAGGWIELPRTLGDLHLLSSFLEPIFPVDKAGHAGATTELVVQAVSAAAALGGLGLAWLWFAPDRARAREGEARGWVPGVPAALHRLWAAGWGFDALYDRLFVRPWTILARSLRRDPVDRPFTGLAGMAARAWAGLRTTQTGAIRTYTTALALGAALLLALVLVL